MAKSGFQLGLGASSDVDPTLPLRTKGYRTGIAAVGARAARREHHGAVGVACALRRRRHHVRHAHSPAIGAAVLGRAVVARVIDAAETRRARESGDAAAEARLAATVDSDVAAPVVARGMRARVLAVGAERARRQDVRAVGLAAALDILVDLADSTAVLTTGGGIAFIHGVVGTAVSRRASLAGKAAAAARLVVGYALVGAGCVRDVAPRLGNAAESRPATNSRAALHRRRTGGERDLALAIEAAGGWAHLAAIRTHAARDADLRTFLVAGARRRNGALTDARTVGAAGVRITHVTRVIDALFAVGAGVITDESAAALRPEIGYADTTAVRARGGITVVGAVDAHEPGRARQTGNSIARRP